MNKPIVFLDIETTGLNKRRDSIIGIGYKYLGESAQYLQLDGWRENNRRLDMDSVMFLLAELKGCRIVTHNGSFDLPFIRNYYGVDLIDNLYCDTMLLAHTCNENESVGLKAIGARLFGEDATAEQQEVKTSIIANGGTATKKKYELYKADPELIAKYCKKDLELTEAVYNHYMPLLESEGLTKFFFDDEVMPLYRTVTIPMESHGIKLDITKMQQALVDIAADMKVVEAEVQKQLSLICSDFKGWFFDKQYPVKTSGNFLQKLAEMEGEDLPKTATGRLSINKKTFPLIKSEKVKQFISTGNLDKETVEAIQTKLHNKKSTSEYFINISSKDHLKTIMFKYLKERPDRFTLKGAYQLDEKYLQTLTGKYSFIEPLIVYNKLSKIKATYIERFLDEAEDGIFYPSFQQHRTISGRYGSNVQQLPRATQSGHELVQKYTNMIRSFFIARNGKVFIDSDYESLEPHVFAHISGDPGLHYIFNNNEDFYSKIGIAIHGITDLSANKSAPNFLGKVNKPLRQQMKALALGVPYGLTAYKMSKELNIDQKQAQALIDGYMRAYPQLHRWMLETDRKALTEGKIRTLGGRIRHLSKAPELYKKHGDAILDDLLLWKKYNEMPTLYAEAKLDRRELKNLINNSRNVQVQGFAASIVNKACIEVNKEIKNQKLSGIVIAQIHDQIIVECDEVDKKQVAKIIQDKMENTFKLDVKLNAEPAFGYNFGESH